MTEAELLAAHSEQVDRGERFEFGENWRRFLEVLDEQRIVEAERSLQEMLGVGSLEGRTFLDIGSGSGLFSLAARRLGAEQVRSFDFDPASVECTRELRERYFADDPRWMIEEGNILDREFVSRLGRWSIVYSWGVLHHTGAMWQAIENAQSTVADGGTFFLSIYNDQGLKSRIWTVMKKTHNRLPVGLRTPFTVLVMGPRELLALGLSLVQRQPLEYVRGWTEYKRQRGMSRWHDIVDWIGGYPFEVARPEDVFDFLHARGFQLERLATVRGIGCNQYVFSRRS